MDVEESWEGGEGKLAHPLDASHKHREDTEQEGSQGPASCRAGYVSEGRSSEPAWGMQTDNGDET